MKYVGDGTGYGAGNMGLTCAELFKKFFPGDTMYSFQIIDTSRYCGGTAANAAVGGIQRIIDTWKNSRNVQ